MTNYLQNKKIIVGGVILIILLIPLVMLAFTQNSILHQSSSGMPTPVSLNGQIIRPTATASVATAFLAFKKESATSAAVIVDTKDKPVSAVQLAISFDPNILGNISIKPGNFFARALILINKIDYATGTIFYAAVVPPNASPQPGKGVVAWLSYNFAPGALNPTSLQFLPNTKITARGIESSVLKQASSISIASSDN